jgi:hypothetical protein
MAQIVQRAKDEDLDKPLVYSVAFVRNQQGRVITDVSARSNKDVHTHGAGPGLGTWNLFARIHLQKPVPANSICWIGLPICRVSPMSLPTYQIARCSQTPGRSIPLGSFSAQEQQELCVQLEGQSWMACDDGALVLIAQRRFNTLSLLDHYLGSGRVSSDDISWNPSDPNVLSMALPGRISAQRHSCSAPRYPSNCQSKRTSPTSALSLVYA